MQDSKNLIIAIILSCLVIFSWQYFYTGPKLREAQMRHAELEKQKKEAIKPKNIDLQTSKKEQSISEVEKPTIKAKDIKINTGKLHGSISTKGARINNLTLAEYKVTNKKDAKEVVLFSPSGSENAYFAESGWIGADSTVAPTSQTIWYSEDDTLTTKKPITLSWDNNAGLKFFIKISIDENYMMTFDKSVENYGSKTESVVPYGLLNRVKHEPKKSFAILHEGAIGALDEVLQEVRYKDLKEDKKIEFKNTSGWIGITDKYWLAALIPGKSDSFDANFIYFQRNGKDRYQVDYLGQKEAIEPGQKTKTTHHLFAGAKKVKLLDQYSEDLNIPLFDRAVDFGWLYFITKPIFNLMHLFNGMLGNFGLAILLLTITLKILLFPLANKSYVSMHHLKRLQPELMELKERYKNDKAGMNKAVMELYREEKVNPMAGCLPLIVQIPIFFALYKVLFVTIEMRHAPFYGWINDLSAPDPTSVFNLFGLFPWDVPSMLAIGAWPLLMGVTMYIQQQLNPQPTDPIQAKVMKALPFIFIFVFATFPAGLVIYWTWNNLLSILQQWVITRRLPSK